VTTARGQANSADPSSGRISRLDEEILLIKEEMRIKDARMEGIPAQRRPHYLPIEQICKVPILSLRAIVAVFRAILRAKDDLQI